ncbi:DUF3822 family protein [Aquimarina agarilytica]|uniref:DUF3822 family protein n=1 Tax=Aquimarina agarilytica TaxID=1087449 RepID=UPI000287ECE0|nr:DUF3822 family protein [Aquimarina agarilytica]
MTNSSVLNLSNSTYSLSIQLSLNGFSFYITSNTGDIVSKYHESNDTIPFNEQQLLEKVSKIFDSKPELQATFKSIDVIYYNELFTLVPKTLFDEKALKTYINYSVKTLATDYITYDELNTGIINVFIPYVNVNNFLLEKLGEFNFHHSSGILINHVLEKEKYSLTKKVSIFVAPNQFDLICCKGTDLLLFNSFKYTTNEDVLYYLLFCLEQLDLSPNQIEVELINTISTDLFDLLYTYIRNISQPKIEENTIDVLHLLAQNEA